ncbi:hypothetical protein FHW36_10231 [Chitinophaga polysaccharea]|uniref:Fimbrillin-A associated anchor protein Mfa1/Mfa2 n=1 Tax=Chitinophaga polysaccharea TaxID=1293035 RepID=A0A561PVX2_9BACT|nr:hypothetical protein [Chitinophaga polysaccharea]TWF42276.1 hypothetical protein FHW36_10231 [Chitinophaga polysaccharea]
MKTLIFCTALLMVLLTSCSKSSHENIPKDDSQKFAIKFDISGFNQMIGDFDGNARSASGGSTAKTDPDTLKKYINYIYFYVFANGAKLKEVRQTSTDTAFGHIIDSMPAGNYNIAMIGSKDPVTIEPTYGDDRFLVFGLPGTDVFFKNIPISVSGAINQTMTLDRIVSKLKVVIKDKIPTGTKSITISLLSDPQRGGLEVVSMILNKLRLSRGEPVDGGQGLSGYSPDVIGTDTLIGTENFSKEYILFAMSSTKTVVNLLSKDAQGVTISEKNIYNVTLVPGKRTVLSGNLFTTTNLDGVNTSINNAEWAKDSVLINF